MAGWVWNEGVELCQSNQHLCCLPKEMRLFETACWFGMLPGAEFFLWLSTGRMSWRNTRRQHLGRLAMQLRLRWHNISCQRRSSRSASWQSVCHQPTSFCETFNSWQTMDGWRWRTLLWKDIHVQCPFFDAFFLKRVLKSKGTAGLRAQFFLILWCCKQPTISDIIGFRSSRITRVVSQVWQQKGMLWVQQRMEAKLKKSWSGGDCRDSERYGIPPLLADWTLCDCEKWIETANMMVAWVPTFRRFADGLIKGDGWWRVEAVQTVQRREIRVKKVWHQHPSFLMWKCHGLVAGLAWCQ